MPKAIWKGAVLAESDRLRGGGGQSIFSCLESVRARISEAKPNAHDLPLERHRELSRCRGERRAKSRRGLVLPGAEIRRERNQGSYRVLAWRSRRALTSPILRAWHRKRGLTAAARRKIESAIEMSCKRRGIFSSHDYGEKTGKPARPAKSRKPKRRKLRSVPRHERQIRSEREGRRDRSKARSREFSKSSTKPIHTQLARSYMTIRFSC